MLRAIRLKLPEQSVFWMAHAFRHKGDPQRMLDLLYYSAFTDNIATHLMQSIELKRLRRLEELDGSDFGLFAWALALSPKPYEWERTQQAYMAVADYTGEYADYPTGGLINHVKMALIGRDSTVYGLTYELYKRGPDAKKGFKDMVREALEIGIGHDLFVMWSLVEGSTHILDQNYGLPFILLAAAGSELVGQDVIDIPIQEVVHYADTLDMKEEPEIPEWAYKEDLRFAEGWLSQANMAMMYKQRGRLNPEDQGQIFRTKGGIWSPVVKDTGNGSYQIQSQSTPKEFYEVHLGEENSCTCPAHVFRHMECKHIRFIEKEVVALPFRMPAS
ncbi:MAG TPA: hypothetical protein ENI27_07670 [bacterium]|nr:hypothetical protein [bacterium]